LALQTHRRVVAHPTGGEGVEEEDRTRGTLGNLDKNTLQVDSTVLSAHLDDLVAELGLQNAYNIFVLNPNSKWTRAP
jgi:hypothetical protein